MRGALYIIAIERSDREERNVRSTEDGIMRLCDVLRRILVGINWVGEWRVLDRIQTPANSDPNHAPCLYDTCEKDT